MIVSIMQGAKEREDTVTEKERIDEHQSMKFTSQRAKDELNEPTNEYMRRTFCLGPLQHTLDFVRPMTCLPHDESK